MKPEWRFSLIIYLILFGSPAISLAQQTVDPTIEAVKSTATPLGKPQATPTPTPCPTGTPRRQGNFVKDVLRDQKAVWLSPFHLKTKDLKWVAPIGLTAAALIATDRETSSWVGRNGSLPKASRFVSHFGEAATTGGVPAGFYIIGHVTKNERAKETGRLAAEALINAQIVTRVIKYAAGRTRPNFDSGRGRFFTDGNSFPSGHSTTAWSVATVIAYEYHDRPLIRYGAFAVAAAVSLSRYAGRNHFPGDILVGSAIGFAMGRFVYRTRHICRNANEKKSKIVTWVPLITPYFDRKTSTYGGRLTWQL